MEVTVLSTIECAWYGVVPFVFVKRAFGEGANTAEMNDVARGEAIPRVHTAARDVR